MPFIPSEKIIKKIIYENNVEINTDYANKILVNVLFELIDLKCRRE